MENRVIIFDLEATCIEDNRGYIMETIEIGAIDNFGNVFSSFVKPIVNPILSAYCKNLTTITQEDVDNADTFDLVILDFIRFIDGDKILSWGEFDKNQLVRDLELHRLDMYKNQITDNYKNLKDYYKEVTGFKAGGTRKVMNKLGIEFVGTQHRAITDSINLQKIFFYLQDLEEKEKNA